MVHFIMNDIINYMISYTIHLTWQKNRISVCICFDFAIVILIEDACGNLLYLLCPLRK